MFRVCTRTLILKKKEKKKERKTGLGHIEKEAHALEAIGYVRGSAHRSHF